MKITNLELKNFLSHVDTSLHISDYEGLVLVEGRNSDGHYSSNGSGKSTLLEGIIYALTGNTLRGVGVNDVVNRRAGKDTEVTLDFSTESGDYQVSRYRNHTIEGNKLDLWKIDERATLLSKRLDKETQKVLDDIVGISYKILVSTMLLGEGLSSRFTQLSDPEKKSLIESTLNLNYDMSKLREAANSQLKALKLRASNLEGQISILENLRVSDIETLEDSINDAKSCIKIYEETISHLEEERSMLQTEVDTINPKLQIITNALNTHQTLANSYVELMQSNAHYQEERDRVTTGANPVCALCHQLLNSAESKQTVVDSYNAYIQDNLSKMNAIEEELSKLPDKDILESKASELSRDYAEKSKKIRDIDQDITSYRVKISESNNCISLCIKEIDEAGDSEEKLRACIEEKSLIDKDIKKYEFFYSVFSPTGIIVDILSDAVDYINIRLATYSEVLLEKNYKIQFVKGKISLVDSKGSSYQSLSNGEKRRLDISIQFALHDYVSMYCGMHMDTLFIDEILDTLDDTGVDNIFEVLRLKLDYCRLHSIFVITHNDSLKDKFDKVITVSKDFNGDSHLE